MTAIEVRDDADGTDSLIETILRKLDGEDVYLRGDEWRAVIDTPYALVLHQWASSEERDAPSGPKVRITFTVHVEDVADGQAVTHDCYTAPRCCGDCGTHDGCRCGASDEHFDPLRLA